MNLLKELLILKEAEDEADKEEKKGQEEEKTDGDTPTPEDDAEENEDEGTDDIPPEDAEESVGSVSEAEGFEKSSDNIFAFGKTRKVTLLTKNETLGGMDLTIQYVINPNTGAWSFRACIAGQSAEDMVEFATGEDPSSLIKHLKKKKKLTPHQAVEYLNPPADKVVKKGDEEIDKEVKESVNGQYHRKSEWIAEAKRRGYEIENNGANKLVAHLDGDEKGMWDPTYGGSGYGWFDENERK